MDCELYLYSNIYNVDRNLGKQIDRGIVEQTNLLYIEVIMLVIWIDLV